jgi:hypothetical protein
MSARDALFEEHIGRLKAATLSGYTLASVPEWICDNTWLRGQKFSFKDHEYQLEIVRDQSPQKNIRKCSQVGISELSARACLAAVNILEASTFIYTLPTADFAKQFVKTRFDPIIQTSPALSSAVNVTADNTTMKQFGQSFVYIKGTVGTSAAISIPADGVVHDELDFSDPEVVSNYQSRLTHSPYKIKWKFSTPTVDGYGISAEFNASRQFWNFVRCCHCNEWFLPDYFAHVKIPGFTGDLRDIRKTNIHETRYTEAYVECPKCGKKPSLQPEHRQWVLKNPDAHYAAAGWQIQPFDAPNVISCGDLIHASTTYQRYIDFVNFGLGLPAEDTESTLLRSEIDACYVRNVEAKFWSAVMGIDMGMTCYIVVSGVDGYGRMFTVHTETVPLPRLEQRKKELARDFNVRLTVMDSLPYTDLLMRLQQSDQNLYGAIYVTNKKSLLPFSVKKEEEEKDDADLRLRQVNINKSKALDGLMTFIRTGNWQILEDQNRETLTKHLTDMKRVQEWTAEREVSYVWRKSNQGDDHFHHALLYCWVASQMQGVAQSTLILPTLISKFKVKS